MNPEDLIEDLIKAAKEGNLELIKEILANHQIDINYVDEEGFTALYRAILGGHKEVVEYLLNKKARYDIAVANLGNRVAVHLTLNSSGYTNKHTYDMLELLKKAGADLNAQHDDGHSLLRFACYYADLKLAKYLLAMGLRDNPNTLLRTVLAGLRFVSTGGRLERINSRKILIQYCIALGADINYPGKTWTEAQWKQAQEQKQFEELYSTIYKTNTPNNIHIRYTQSPLVRAIQENRLALVQFLLDLGANPNQPDIHGTLPFSLAVENVDALMMKILLCYGGVPAFKTMPFNNSEIIYTPDLLNFFSSETLHQSKKELKNFNQSLPITALALQSQLLSLIGNIKPSSSRARFINDDILFSFASLISQTLQHTHLNQRDHHSTLNTPLHAACLSQNRYLLKAFLLCLPSLKLEEQLQILIAKNASGKTILDIAIEAANTHQKDKVEKEMRSVTAAVPTTAVVPATAATATAVTTPMRIASGLAYEAQRWFNKVMSAEHLLYQPSTLILQKSPQNTQSTASSQAQNYLKPFEHLIIDDIMFAIQTCINTLVAQILNTMPILANAHYDIILKLAEKLAPQNDLSFGTTDESQALIQIAFEEALTKHNLKQVFEKQKAEVAKDAEAAKNSKSNMNAQYNLGIMYERGIGVEKNSLMALEYFKMLSTRDNYQFKQKAAIKAARLKNWITAQTAPIRSYLMPALEYTGLRFCPQGKQLIVEYAFDENPNNISDNSGNRTSDNSTQPMTLQLRTVLRQRP